MPTCSAGVDVGAGTDVDSEFPVRFDTILKYDMYDTTQYDPIRHYHMTYYGMILLLIV